MMAIGSVMKRWLREHKWVRRMTAEPTYIHVGRINGIC